MTIVRVLHVSILFKYSILKSNISYITKIFINEYHDI